MRTAHLCCLGLATLLAFGCGPSAPKKETTAPAVETESDVETAPAQVAKTDLEVLATLVDKGCQCKESACINAVLDEADEAFPDEKAEAMLEESPEETKELLTRMAECDLALRERAHSQESAGATSRRKLEAFVGFIDRACACKDLPCMEVVQEEATAELSDDEVEALSSAYPEETNGEVERLMKCMSTLMKD